MRLHYIQHSAHSMKQKDSATGAAAAAKTQADRFADRSILQGAFLHCTLHTYVPKVGAGSTWHIPPTAGFTYAVLRPQS